MFLYIMYFYVSVFFFSTLTKCKFKNLKIQFFGSKMMIFWKFRINLLMKTCLTVLFKVCKSLGARSDWVLQNYRFSHSAICNSVQALFSFLIRLLYSWILDFIFSFEDFWMNYSLKNNFRSKNHKINKISWNICD